MVKGKQQQQELYKKLWDMANELRGNISANESDEKRLYIDMSKCYVAK